MDFSLSFVKAVFAEVNHNNITQTTKQDNSLDSYASCTEQIGPTSQEMQLASTEVKCYWLWAKIWESAFKYPAQSLLSGSSPLPHRSTGAAGLSSAATLQICLTRFFLPREGSALHSASVLLQQQCVWGERLLCVGWTSIEIALSAGLPFPFHSLTGSQVLYLTQKARAER